MNNTIKPKQSKTIWVNTIIIVISLGSFLITDPKVVELLGDNIGYIGTAVGILGILLRTLTNTGIEMGIKK